MVDPSALLDSMLVTLRSNSDLVAALASPLPTPTAIFAYYTQYGLGKANLEQRIFDQPFNTIMGCWVGTRTGRFNKGESIMHDFALYLKPAGRVSAVFTALREGVCTVPETRKFKLISVDPNVYPVDGLACRARTNFVSQNYGLFDFTEITLTLIEKSVDN